MFGWLNRCFVVSRQCFAIFIFCVLALSSHTTLADIQEKAGKVDFLVLPSEGDSVELRLIVKVGSLQEQDSEQGFAHFVEHLAFNNTQKYPKEALFQKLDSLGLSMGKHTNAQTSFDRTIYKLSVKDVSDERIDAALDILSQWAQHVQFDQAIVDAEKAVIKEEWRMRQPQKYDWQTRYKKALYKNSRYGERLPIGDMAMVEAATAEQLKAFYQRWYKPENATIVVSGDVDESKVAARIKHYFADWDSEPLAPKQTYNLSIKDLPKQLFLTDDKLDSNRLGLNYYSQATRPKTIDTALDRQKWSAAMSILNQRLSQKLLSTQGKVSRAFVKSSYPSPNVFNIKIAASVTDQTFKTGTQFIAQTIQQILEQGITQQELDAWVNNKLRRYRLAKETPKGRASQAMQHVLHDLPLLTQKQWLALLEDYLPKLTVEQVNQTIKAYLSASPSIFVFHNKHTKAPSYEQLDQWLNEGSDKAKLVTHQAVTAEEWLIKPKYEGRIIDSRKSGDWTIWTLNNGMQAYYRYSDESPKRVWYKLSALGGMNQLSQEQSLHARLALEVLSSSGLRNMNGVELGLWMRNQSMSQRPFYGFQSRGIQGKSLTENFDLATRLLHIALTEAAVQEEAWKHIQTKNHRQLMRLDKSRSKAWKLGAENILYQDDTAFRTPALEELEATKPEQLMQVYNQYLKGAQNYQLVIVGDISEAAAKKAVLANIATLPKLAPQSEKPKRGFPRITKPERFVLDNSGERAAQVTYKLILDKKLTTQLKTSEVSYFSQWLRPAFMKALREEEGLVYSVRVSFEGGLPSRKDYTLTISLSCDPENVSKVRERIQIILTQMTQQPPTQEQLLAWQQERKVALKASLKKPSVLVNSLSAMQQMRLSLRQVEDIDYRTQPPKANVMTKVLTQLLSKKAHPVWMVWLP